jgi:hypothetical protein
VRVTLDVRGQVEYTYSDEEWAYALAKVEGDVDELTSMIADKAEIIFERGFCNTAGDDEDLTKLKRLHIDVELSEATA